MPCLQIKTNLSLDTDSKDKLLGKLSTHLSQMLGKPENYIMLVIEDNCTMLMAASTAPMAYMELKSIGLPEDRTAEFSASLCDCLHDETAIPKDRIYIEFANAQRHMWGWNGATF